MTNEISPDMRLFSPEGERLYLTSQERKLFLEASINEDREYRLFCETLHYTGCRPSEALELTPARISTLEAAIIFRSLKKRKKDGRGRIKQPEYRSVPVPNILIDSFDYVFDIRRIQRKNKGVDVPLWTMSRPTAYRAIKRVMNRAGIIGKKATGKGLRHAFGVTMVTKKNPTPINVLADLMGHSSTKTTEVYLKVMGQEKRNLVIDAWE